MKRIFSGVDGIRERGRPYTRLLHGVGNMLNEKGVTIQPARRCAKGMEKGGEKEKWRSI